MDNNNTNTTTETKCQQSTASQVFEGMGIGLTIATVFVCAYYAYEHFTGDK